MKNSYSKEELTKIIDEASKIKKEQEESYTYDEIEKIANNMNIPKSVVREAIKIYSKNKISNSSKVRRIKKSIIYIIYMSFWAAFISILVIVPKLQENHWNSWMWLIPSLALVGLIMGAFINELEGSIIGFVSGGLSGLLVLYLIQWTWGQILIGIVLGFVAFIVFLFRIKPQIDSVIK